MSPAVHHRRNDKDTQEPDGHVAQQGGSEDESINHQRRIEDVMARAQELIREAHALAERGETLSQTNAYLRSLEATVALLPAQIREQISNVSRQVAHAHLDKSSQQAPGRPRAAHKSRV